MNKIDQAWEEKRYDEVLLLLQQDSFYPKNFNYEDLNDCDAGKPLKDFVDEMIKLHEHVRNDDLVKVKEITLRYKSEFYFNSENQSAALTALENKKFRIYAYLKWIGVVSGDDEEKLIDKDLGITEKETLEEALRSYFREDGASSILNLIRKSKSVNSPKNFTDIMTEYYIKLNKKIPDILNVFRYENNLEITFYCKGENDVGEAGDDCYGVTVWSDFDYLSEISIHWDPMEKYKTRGNLAYKLTLFAMKMVFKNECKPYQVMDSTGETEFEEITEDIKANLTNLSGAEEDNLAKAFKSNSAHHHSELIARVTQTLVEFKNGEEWLKNNTPDLLAFYRKKVIPKCQEFVSRNFLIKPRHVIKTLNEKFGGITSLVKINLFFVNLGFLTEFLNSQKISVIVTKNIRLGLIRVLQALERKIYVDYYDNFIIFKTENCLTFLPDIKIAFGSEDIEFLLLDCASVSNSSLKDGIAEITSRLGHDEKIIFVAGENQIEVFEEYSKSNPSWGLMRDENFCLDDLDLESEEKILGKEILFQGRKTNLDEWLSQDTEFRKLITSDIIWQLVCDGPHKIGNKIFGTSNLEGSYAQILQKINIESLMREIEKSDAVFIFMGDKDKFTKLNLKGEIALLDLKNFEAINKKLLWADENFEDCFKEFCQNNPIKKVYLINISADGTLVLQQIYSPDFHMKRKYIKIVVDVDMLEGIIQHNKEEKFIFTGCGSTIENWKKKYSNVKLSDESEGWLDSEDTIHWFQVENGVLIWKNSRGSIENLAEAISEELSSQHLMEENELVKDALERKVVIISDEPGMGKSTTITKLYESPDIIKSHWIIRINFKDCGKEIKNLPSTDFTITDLISFLQGAEKNLNNTLTTHFLDLVLDPQKRIGKDLLLVFDGFDELSDEEDRNKTINLLKFLNNETKSKVWIECRLDYKNLLQDELNSFALQFSPIDNEMKKKVIKKYYGDRLNLVLSEKQFYDAFNGDKVEIYVENFIRKMESIFQGSLSTILRAPLQLNLLLDNSTQYFLNWFENQSNIDFSYLGDNLFQVYENYISRKYDNYFKKTQTEYLIREAAKTTLELYHKALTRNRFCKISVEDLKKHEPLLLLIGLVQRENENLQFFHFTFREFYSAKMVVQFLTDDTIKENDFAEDARKYLMEVFTEPGYELIRRFIDSRFQNIKLSRISPKMSYLAKVSYFPILSQNSSSDSMEFVSDKESDRMKAGSNLKELLHVNISENNSNIFDLFFSCSKPFFKSKFHLMMLKMVSGEYPPSLLHCSVISGNPRIFDALFETMKEVPTDLQKTIMHWEKRTILHIAAEYHRVDIFMTLLEKIKLIFSLEDQKRILRDENLLIFSVLKSNWKIVEIVLKYAEEILAPEERKTFFTEEHEGENILFLAVKREDQKLLQILMAESEKILPEDRNEFFTSKNKLLKENLLFIAVKSNSFKMTKELIKIAKEILTYQQREDFLLTKNNAYHGSLQNAFKNNNFEITEILLREAESFLSLEKRINLFLWHIGRIDIDEFLISALSEKHIKLVEYLLKIGEKLLLEEEQTKPSGIEETRMTLLFMAAIKIKAQIIDLLKKFEKISFSRRGMEKSSERLSKTVTRNERFPVYKFFNKIAWKDIHFELITEMLLKEVKNIITKGERYKFFTLGKEAVQMVIILAVVQNNVELVQLLLQNEKKIILEEECKKILTDQSYNLGNILLIATREQKLDIIRAVLRKSEEILSPQERKRIFFPRSNNSSTCLFKACKEDNSELLEILLKEAENSLSVKQRIKLFFKEPGIENSVFSSIVKKRKNFKLLKLLLEYAEKMLPTEHQKKFFLYRPDGCAKDFSIFHILHYANLYDQVRITEYILEKFGKILTPEAREIFFLGENDKGKNALYIACREERLKIVEILLKGAKHFLPEGDRLKFFKGGAGARKNVLIYAIMENNLDLIEILLNNAEKILLVEEQKELFMLKNEKTGENVLEIAARQDNSVRIMKYLIRKSWEVLSFEEKKQYLVAGDNDSENALYLALQNSNGETRVILLKDFVETLFYPR